MEIKFRALRTISVILKVIAWIVAVLTIIGFLAMLVGGAALSQFGGRYGAPGMLGPLGGVAMAFYILIIGAIWFISLLAGADLILVILAIEENTRGLKPQA
jgi:Zn-dependent protease with chaperone function